MTSRQKLVIGHLLVFLGISVGFWYLFRETLQDSEGARVVQMFLISMVFFPWLLSGFLLWKELSALYLGSIIAVLPVFFFAMDIRVYGGLLVAAFCIFLGAKKSQHEIQERLSFLPARAFLVAKQSSVLGFSLALSLGYFLSIRTFSWDDLSSRLHFGEGTVRQVISWAGYIQPEFASIGKDNQTVDDYIRSLNRQPSSGIQDDAEQFRQLDDQLGQLRAQGIQVEFSGDALLAVREAAETNMLVSGRKQFEGLVGRPVRGNEPVADLFSEAIEKKLFAITEAAQVRERIPDRVLPTFITLLFFLTLWPVLLIIFSLWSPIGAFLIALFRRFHWIEILKHTVTQERLEE